MRLGLQQFHALLIMYPVMIRLNSPGHDIKLHPHRVNLYRIGCVGHGLVLAKALM